METKNEVMQQLFKNEITVLERAKDFSNLPNQSNGELTIQYKELLNSYKHLLNFTMKITAISDYQINLLIDKDAYHTNLESLSYQDVLTSVYNRSYLQKILPTLTASQSEPLSCLYIDMNGLKLTNDVFGHEVGDEMLVSLANILLSCCNKNEIVVRWGGDEFLVVMPNTTAAESEELKNKIKGCFFTNEKKLPISAAIGSETAFSFSGDINEFLQKAEHRMYKDKFLEGSRVRKNIVHEFRKSFSPQCIDLNKHIKRVEKAAVSFALKLHIHPKSFDMEKLKLLVSLYDIEAIDADKTYNINEYLASRNCKTFGNHSEYGYRMAQALGETNVAECILGIHENWDGTGVPFGLKGEEIPFLSRLLSIVDAYDLLRHGINSTDTPLAKEEALNEMRAASGKMFDPKLLTLFYNHVDEFFR